jgi:hypothetical protein
VIFARVGVIEHGSRGSGVVLARRADEFVVRVDAVGWAGSEDAAA